MLKYRIYWIVIAGLIFTLPLFGQNVQSFIAPKALWKYHDGGIDLGMAWRTIEYSDTDWNSGRALFGYGRDDVETRLNYGSNASNKIPTYYFRKTVTAGSLNQVNTLEFRILFDDGIVVYINGTEVIRKNIDDDYNHYSFATDNVSDEDENSYIKFDVPSKFLNEGENVIAVEVHQVSSESADVAFDLFCNLSSALPRNVVINEVLASNHSAYIEADFNQFVDFIELFNTTDERIDLSGYYLSDSRSNHFKWRIPENTTIAAGEFVLFYPDGLDTMMHPGFKLSQQGELVGLYDEEGYPVDTIDMQEQITDISYGRNPYELEVFEYYTEVTPGEPNSDEGFESSEQSGEVSFNTIGGVYPGPVQIEISGVVNDGSIRYTTDGGVPEYSSARYDGSLSISNTTVIRARIFENGKLPGKVSTQTYLIDEDISLPIMALSTDDDNLHDNRIGIYLDENVSTRKPWERPAVLEFFEEDGSRVLNAEVDIRLFGRGAIHFPEKSLAIFARDNQGKDYFDYPLFPSMPLDYFESFLLRSSSDDWRYTLFKDGMIQSVVEGQTELDVQAFRQCILFINGNYMGIHNIREKYNESYLAAHHHIDPNNIDLLYIDNDYYPARIEVKSGDVGAYKSLLSFIEKEDLSDDASFELVEQIMDVDNFIDYIIVEVIASNKSWKHNRRVWRPRTPDGKFKWLLFDLDYGYSLVNLDILERIGRDDPVFYNLLANEGFKQRFIQRLMTLDQTVFHANRVVPFIDSFEDGIEDQINRHLQKWGGTYPGMITSKADWRNKVQIARSYAMNRSPINRQHLEKFFNLSGFISGTIQVSPENSGDIIADDVTLTAASFDGKFTKGQELQFKAIPKAGFEFVGWETGSSNGVSIISSKSEWRYLDDGSDQGTGWRDPGFDDGNWSQGHANLGFANENDTQINQGSITYYFRKEFTVNDPTVFVGLSVNLLRDDGAIVYVNGQEVIRSNMPSGNITFQTLASTMAGWTEERQYYDYDIDPSVLQAGSNLIAVEVHQDVPSSNDLSFDLILTGQASGESPINPISLSKSSDFTLTAEFAAISESQIVISELSYSPPGDKGGKGASFIEITNISDKEVDITGYAFTSGISFVFPGTTLIGPKEHIIIVKDQTNFDFIEGQVFEWVSGNLSESGELISLKTPDGDIVDQVNYLTTAPWPDLDNLNGESIELLDTGSDNNEGANWQASLGLGGTPNLRNSILFEQVKLNEFSANSGQEGYLSGVDWIEIYNGASRAVDLDGLYLSDDPFNPLKWQIQHNTGALTAVNPSDMLLVLADNDEEKGGLHANFKLSANSGSITLSMGFPGWLTTLDHVDYALQTEGYSLGRFPNGEGSWTEISDPSPKATNIPPSNFIITPTTAKSEDWLPIYAKIYKTDGTVDYGFHGEKELTVDVGTISPSTIKFTKGVGYAVVQITGSGHVEIKIQGLDDAAVVEVKETIPIVELTHLYNTDLTLQSDVDYYIPTGLTIETNGSLTIEKGARIHLGEKADIVCKGPLAINGTAMNPVVFMSNLPDEKWGGLEIRNVDVPSTIDYAFFFHGGGDTSKLFFHTETQPVIMAAEAEIYLNNTYIIENVGKAFGSLLTHVHVENSLFATSTMGPEFRQSFTQVDRTWIVDIPDQDKLRESNDNDGIYFWKALNDGQPPHTLTNCVIANVEDDGIDMLATDLLIYNTIFFEILDKATSAGYWSDVEFNRCLVIDCNAGIIPGWWSDASVIHSTFYNTARPVKNSIYGATEVWNSILSKFADVAWKDELSNDPTFYYSISDTRVLPGENNLFGDPKMINPSSENYHLQANSPAINAGDPALGNDPDGTLPDLGKYPYLSGNSDGFIIVNEIFYNPSEQQGKDSDYEFIELFNPTGEDYNLSGHHFSGAFDFTFPTGTWLEGGKYLVLSANPDSYNDLNCKVLDWGSEKLSNDGEEIILKDRENNTLSQINFGPTSPWPVQANGVGFSLELDDPYDDNDDPANWRSSYEAWGSPGRENYEPDFSEVFINEILLDNTSGYLDDKDKYSPWVELHNMGNRDLNIGGYLIKNENNQISYTIPVSSRSSTLIPAKGFLILYLDDRPDYGIQHIGLNFGKSAGRIGLYYLEGDGQNMLRIDRMSFSDSQSDVSQGRYPDGNDEVISFETPTPKKSNIKASDLLLGPSLFTSNEEIPLLFRISDPTQYPEMITESKTLIINQEGGFEDETVRVYKGLGMEWMNPAFSEDLFVSYNDDSIRIAFDDFRPIRIRSEKILKNQTWTSDHDYHIKSALNIPEDVTLTIEAGTRIFVKEYSNITVDGHIKISGEKGNPVVFIPLETHKGWGGIQIHPGSGFSRISHVFLIEGGNGSRVNPGVFDEQAVIESERPLYLDNVYIIDALGKGIHVKDAALEMSNCVLYNCLSGIELQNAPATINGTHFTLLPDDDNFDPNKNQDAISAYGFTDATGTITISDCSFYGIGDEGSNLDTDLPIFITNSFFEAIGDKAIVIREADFSIDYSVIEQAAIAISIEEGAQGEMDHLTIHNNVAGIVVEDDGSSGRIRNSILADHESDDFEVDPNASLIAEYVLSTAEDHEGEGNSMGNPRFSDASNSDFRLRPGSPAINTGDPDFDLDDDGSITDMGKYPYLQTGEYKNLIINEVHYNPADLSTSTEFIELYNPGGQVIDLEDYSLSGDVVHQFHNGDYIQAGEFMVICKDPNKFAGQSFNSIRWNNGDLDEENGSVILMDPDGEIVNEVIYNDSEDWTQWPNGKGPSLELIDFDLPSAIITSWRPSYFIGGTPGRENIVPTQSGLFINEFMARNVSTYPDEFGFFCDWIELYNSKDYFIDLKQFSISRDQSDPEMHVFTADHADSLFLPPGSFIVFWADDLADAGAYHLPF